MRQRTPKRLLKHCLQTVSQSGCLEKVQLLLDVGAEMGYVDADGYDVLLDTVLSQAQEAEKIALVQLLIHQGASLNGKSHLGNSTQRCGWLRLV